MSEINSKNITVAGTGADGAMGGEVVAHLLKSEFNFNLRLFIYNHTKKFRPFFNCCINRRFNSYD